MAASESPSGQAEFKHFSTSLDSLEQIQDKSFKPEQSEFLVTWATQAKRQAGGVAKVDWIWLAKTIKVEIFKIEDCIANVFW